MDLTHKLYTARSQLVKLEGLVKRKLYSANMQAKAPKVQYFVEFLKAHSEVTDTQVNAYTAFKDKEVQCHISNFKAEVKWAEDLLDSVSLHDHITPALESFGRDVKSRQRIPHWDKSIETSNPRGFFSYKEDPFAIREFNEVCTDFYHYLFKARVLVERSFVVEEMKLKKKVELRDIIMADTISEVITKKSIQLIIDKAVTNISQQVTKGKGKQKEVCTHILNDIHLFISNLEIPKESSLICCSQKQT